MIFCSVLRLSAQTVIKGFEYTEIVNMSDTYRQMPSLSFNLVFSYADSARPDSIQEQLTGSYKIQNGMFWAMIDSTELIQGSNFNISVFHRDSVITIAPTQPAPDLMQLPFLDSLFRSQNIDSMNVTNVNDSTRSLRMYFNARSQYTSCVIQYDPGSYLFKSVTYNVKTPPTADDPGSGISVLKIVFSNYSTQLINEDYFREDKFIYKQGSQFLGQPPYNTFQLVVNTGN
jgi:hypothetical protein